MLYSLNNDKMLLIKDNFRHISKNKTIVKNY